MKQFTKLNVKIARLFILVRRVKLSEIEWKNTKDASDVDMKILKFTNTWNKATIHSTFPMLKYCELQN